MIVFFPELYLDELAYSLFARYHVHSGNISFSSTARELFQTKDAIPNPEFFAPLSEEVRSIITRSSTMEDFIQRFNGNKILVRRDLENTVRRSIHDEFTRA